MAEIGYRLLAMTDPPYRLPTLFRDDIHPDAPELPVTHVHPTLWGLMPVRALHKHSAGVPRLEGQHWCIWYQACSVRRSRKGSQNICKGMSGDIAMPHRAEVSERTDLLVKKLDGIQQSGDPRKRPLLTAEQLHIMHRGSERTKKGAPREEFEKLFRREKTKS